MTTSSRLNAAWHRAHRMPARATLDQRIAWHLAHAKACGCRPMPRTVLVALKARTVAPARRKTVKRVARTVRATTTRRRPSQGDVRRFALALPETIESSHHGRPDLRVKNRIFASLPDGGRTVNVKTTPVNLDALVTSDPRTFRDVWGGRWVGIQLATVNPAVLRGLLLDAWMSTAPARVVAAYRAAKGQA